ncbi:bifunctional phosphatase PAP2/diacylglycerol kinase family protein [Rhodococcus sp. 27YEA15]|uniref:bifunctional phosphatase PAP2/diacylglycerol kinase family protein n=1 Tax=Rhodococcus sp. 27YEA15 TaxID=3156259 RepID=UPI003C7C6FCE
MERTGALRPSWLDPAMRALSRGADRGVLWLAVAGILALVGGRPRRAAARGVLALWMSSALANGILKPLFPRRRPPVQAWLNPKRGVPLPRSSSFPSGHSASAAAFTTAVAMESPAAGAVVAPLAAAVAYSRVHNGVHWPSDVLAGIAVGGVVAAGTRRWWAIRDEEPADLGPQAAVPALPGGDGLVVFVNPGSGSEDDGIVATIGRCLPSVVIVELDPQTDFGEQIEAAVTDNDPQALGVCGGDGTVVTVATAAATHSLPLAVFPGGTLNHFARDLGAADTEDTARAVELGHAAFVDHAMVRTDTGITARFLNTASLGGYPDAVRLREKWEPRFGKWPAAGLAMVRVLAAAEPMLVTIDGAPASVWMLFVGNGRYSPADQVPMSRPHLDRGKLDVRYLRADRRFSRSRLLFAAATGTLGRSRIYVHDEVTSISVRVLDSPVAVATDGEVVADARQFEFRTEPAATAVYRLNPNSG